MNVFSKSQYLSVDKEKELIETVSVLLTKGKGLLAVDESISRYGQRNTDVV